MTERWLGFIPPKALTLFGVVLALCAFGLLVSTPYMHVHKGLWERGLHYQLYFALLVIVLSTLFSYYTDTFVVAAGWLIGFGSLFFSASFCLHAYTGDSHWQNLGLLGAAVILVGFLFVPIGLFRAKAV